MKPIHLELEEVRKERDKLVDFARVQTDKLHIAIRVLNEIEKSDAGYIEQEGVEVKTLARQALDEIKSLID